MIEVNSRELPKGWVLSKIGQICTQPQYGYTTKATQTGTIKLLRTTDITSGKINWNTVPYCTENPKDIDKYLLGEGDIVISRAGSIGVSYLIKDTEASVFASYLIRFKPYIDRKFFKFFLDSPFYWKNISEKKLGIAVLNINANKLKDIDFPLPPLSEQHRIIEKIEELFSDLDKGIENLKTTQQQLKIYRQAVLKWAFEGKLTAKWREKKKQQGELKSADELLVQIKAEREKRDRTQLQEWNKAVKTWEANGKQGKKPTKPKKAKELPILTELEITKLPRIPDNWFYDYLAYIGDLGRGKSKHRPRNNPKLFGGKYPFIQTGEVRNARGTLREYSKTYSDFGLEQSKLWSIGTLCITIAANIADTCILGIEACFPDSIVGFSAFPEVANTKYVDYFIQSMKAKIEAFAPATAQKNINLEILENLVICYCSIEEQHQIVQEIEFRLSICDRLEATITENLTRAEALRQSILKQAFEGKIVPQDPNDEPADKLIERIRQEKRQQTDGKQLELEI